MVVRHFPHEHGGTPHFQTHPNEWRKSDEDVGQRWVHTQHN